MKNARRIVCAVLVGLAALTATAAARKNGEEPDRLCQMLFDEYVVSRGKINTSTRMAAAHIVAERGRTNGFWKDVFAALPTGDVKREIACVRVLGKMLEHDAIARDAQRRFERTGEVQQARPSICVGEDVVKELIARGAKAEDGLADHYAIALARARVPEARELFRKMLAGEPGLVGDGFHAAVGLAQLGDPAGFEWLIARSTDPTHTVSNAWPRRVPSYNLDVCCAAALQELVGQGAPRTRPEWQAWWNQVDKAKLAPGRVDFVEP